MKLYSKLLVALLLSLPLCVAYGANLDPAHYPVDLMYLGKPVDPLCFFNLARTSEAIQLSSCGIAKTKYQAISRDIVLSGEGFYGFDWKDPSLRDWRHNAIQGGSYYKAWAVGHRQYWLYTVNNGGGSGEFTAIHLYTRTSPDAITLKTIAGGDRCNGGIVKPQDKGASLIYGVSLTAADFLPLAADNPHRLKAYTDLAACAACCLAEAYFEVDKSLKPKMLYVDLGDLVKLGDMPNQGKYQICFNKLVLAHLSKGENKLNEAGLKSFVAEFNKACVPH